MTEASSDLPNRTHIDNKSKGWCVALYQTEEHLHRQGDNQCRCLENGRKKKLTAIPLKKVSFTEYKNKRKEQIILTHTYTHNMNRSQKQKYKWLINTGNMFNSFSPAEKEEWKGPEIPSYPYINMGYICFLVIYVIHTNDNVGKFQGWSGILPDC